MNRELRKLQTKYYEIFKDFENEKISEDEALLYVFLGEGLISRNEFDKWFNALNEERRVRIMLGNPQLIRFNQKYSAIIEHYRNGNCTAQEMLEAIEILENINNLEEND